MYKPARNPQVKAARLAARDGDYFVLKQPETRAYLRLSEEDYALWWQMDGRFSVKQLLFYSLKRYRRLPIGHLNRLIDELRDGRFLCETPVDVYDQMEAALAARAPSSRGRRLLQGFLETEAAVSGLDDFFTPLYQQVKWLFTFWGQMLLLAIIILGGSLFVWLFRAGAYSLTAQGGWSVLSIFAANLLVIFIHELAHGVTVKHYGRELDRGGFLIYWGMPAFFVDTRDIWMSPSKARIAVSWAGPHSGLVLGGLVGAGLTAVSVYAPEFADTFWATFLFQVGFMAFLSVFVNVNPLLELDGYFILMDWLEMPGLRERAFAFWREEAWPRLRQHTDPRRMWASLNRAERIFAFYGALAFVYSAYALWLALYFWQSRLLPLAGRLWQEYGLAGRLVVLLATAVLVIPAVYYLLQFGWSRLRAGLGWLARRDLLSRPDVLALLLSLPLLVGLPLLWMGLSTLPRRELFLALLTWLLHLAAIAALVEIARQLPGSRFQWAIWALAAAPVGLTLGWVTREQPILHDASLMGTAVAILAAGVVSWFTVGPKWLEMRDRLLLAVLLLLGPLTYWGMQTVAPVGAMALNSRWLATAIILLALFSGLAFMAPLLVNFSRSRFALPWLLLVVAITAVPWLQYFPFLHLPVAVLWLYAGLLYLVVGALAQFIRVEFEGEAVPLFNERAQLVEAFNNFVRAFFHSYEQIFGGRRLADIQAQMLALGPVDPDDAILEIGERARQALLLAVDRLDDLAGTPFTRQAGQAAYDSLPWLQAEALARHVLGEMMWGSQLATGFIQARDRRAELIRRADIFAGFDQDGVAATLAVAQAWSGRGGMTMARGGAEAKVFYLIETGEVAIIHDGVQVGVLKTGGYFGTMALLDSGVYQFTYRTLTPVTAVAIDRDKFDPLLRVDTTLAEQVSSGARERTLLKQMPLFSDLSPQELASIDSRLQRRRTAAGELIVQQGDARSHLYIVKEGLVEVSVRVAEEGEAAEERVSGRLGPGEHFGEYALFADTPYQATYRAVTDTVLLLLDEAKFDELAARYAQMSHYVEQIGSGRLIATRRRLGPEALIS